MTKAARILKQQRKQEKLERLRKTTVERLGDNGNGNGHTSRLEIAHKVMGAVLASAEHDSGHLERGVKVRGLRFASPDVVTGVLDRLKSYNIVSNQGGGVYNTLATPGTDEYIYLQVMRLSCEGERGRRLTPAYVSKQLGTDQESAELVLLELLSRGALKNDKSGYHPNTNLWEL